MARVIVGTGLATAAAAVAGSLASRGGVEIDDTRPIATSFPVFEALLDGLAT